MNKNIYLIVTGMIFVLVAVLHLLRLINQWPVQIGLASIPLWVSCVALLLASILFFWAFLLVRIK